MPSQRGGRLRRGLTAVLFLIVAVGPVGGAFADQTFTPETEPSSTSPSASPASPSSGDPTPTEADLPTACVNADLLASRQQYEKAIDAYLLVLQRTPDESCVTAGLVKMFDEMDAADADAAVDTCAVVNKLQDLEAYEDADRVLIAYIEKGGTCEDVTLGPPESTWDQLAAWGKWGGPGLAVLILIASGVLFLLRTTSKRYRRWRRRWLRPEMVIAEFTHAEGPELSDERVKAAIKLSPDAEEEASNDSFHIVDAYQDLVTEAGEMAKISEYLAPAAATVRVFGLALGRDKWKVTGDVRAKPDEKRVYCDLLFTAKGVQETTAQFSVATNGAAAISEEEDVLLACVGGWVRMQAARYAEDDLPAVPSAQAYGWLRGGIKAQEYSLLSVAQTCYDQARGSEEGTSYTRAAIARALVEAEMASDEERAATVLDDQLDRLSTVVAENDPEIAADLFRLGYARAAALVHRALARDASAAERTGLISKAVSGAEQTAAAARKFTDTPVAAAQTSASALAFISNTLVPACDILAWGAQLRGLGEGGMSEADKVAARELRAEVTRLSDLALTYRVRYNVACFWSTWLAHMPNEYRTSGPSPAEEGIRQLRSAIAEAPALRRDRLVAWARVDPSLKKLRESAEFAAASPLPESVETEAPAGS